MSDLVQMLRMAATKTLAVATVRALASQAADEIERLQRDLQLVKDLGQKIDDENARQAKEIEALKDRQVQLNDALAGVTAMAKQHLAAVASLGSRPIESWERLCIVQADALIDYDTVSQVVAG